MIDGKLQEAPPRYAYAVHIGEGDRQPQQLRFSNNIILQPGTRGVSNVELKP